MVEPVTTTVAALAAVVASMELYRKIAESSTSLNQLCINMDNASKLLIGLRNERAVKHGRQPKTMRRSDTYVAWQDQVNTLVEEVNALIEKHKKVHGNFRFKIPSRKLSKKKVKTKTLDAVRLYGLELGDISVLKAPQRIVSKHPESITEYPSMKNHFDAILAHLKENGSKGVTIYGECGVGKTTILKNLNDHEDSDLDQMFELVIWVDASGSCNEMQKEIAARLNIDMNGTDNYKDRIQGELAGKKYLLLLDNVKEFLNVEEIGIYEPRVAVCKIVLTSTSNHTCPPELMSKIVKVSRLNNDEAKRMFRKYLKVDLQTYPGIEDFANYCFGKPYYINMLANIINTASDQGGGINDMLNRLIEHGENDSTVSDVVRNILDMFCEQLQSPEKECFLYCTLYPGDSNIDKNHLFDCWRAESLCVQREEAWNILENLKEKSYLRESIYGPGGEYVRMEKHIWDVALKKLLDDSTDPHLVKAGESSQVDQIPEEEWNQKNRISLVNNDLKSLPKCPNSPTLSSLFLQLNNNLNLIPKTFFNKITGLQVLNLHNTGISSVPSSLEQLTHLKVFYLNDCTRMGKLPAEIEKLNGLEVLDIRGTAVQVNQDDKAYVQKIVGLLRGVPIRTENQWAPLPNIRHLHQLRRLLVSYNAFGNEHDTQDMSRFCKAISNISTTLEELVIVVNADKALCYKMINDVRQAVAPLENLKCLKFILKDGAEAVMNVVSPTDIGRFTDLSPFEVYVGCSISSHQIPDINKYHGYLKFCSQGGPNIDTSIGQVLSRCDAFELVTHRHLHHLSQFGVTNFIKVKGCWIEDCGNIKAITDDPAISAIAAAMLPNLQRLYMKNLPQLESLWMGQRKAGSLDNLKILMLIDLPSLTSFGTDASAFAWPALEVIEIEECPNLKQLPFKIDTALKLRSIKASRTWWDGLTWVEPGLKRRFDKLYSSI